MRFAMVGAGFALLNLLLLWVLVGHLGVAYLWASTISFFALNFAGYCVNKVFTFRLPRVVHGTELLRYYGVMAISLAANLGLMFLLVDVAGMHYLAASLIVTVVLSVANFSGHRRITFPSATSDAGIAAGPLKVLQVSAFFPAHGGGIEAVAGQLAQRLPSAQAHLVWMAGGPPEERYHPAAAQPNLQVDAATSVDFLERRLGLPSPLWSLGSLARLWRHVRWAQVVHVHDYLYLPTLAAMAFAAMQRKPVVLTQHIGEIQFKSKLATSVLHVLNHTLGRLVLGSVSQAVFVGRPVLEYFRHFVRFRREPLLISNGVDHERYHPVEREFSPESPAKLLFVGRFVEKKGVALLRHCVDLPNTHWTFIGRGPLSPARWDVPSTRNMDVRGALPAEQVVPHYQQADLLVLPSTGEGFPLVVQEALACGTPVLVSREVAEAFPVTDARCVFDVELRVANPKKALRDGISRITSNTQGLREARCHASTLAGQWSWKVCAGHYLATYRAVGQ